MSKARGSTHNQAVEQTFNTAIGLHQQGELQRAEMLYRDVLRQVPDHAHSLNMLGVLGCQTGNLAAGADLIRRAIAVDAKQADFHNNLGMAAVQIRDLPSAVEAFSEAVRLRPRFAEAQFNLGNAFIASGEPDKAEAHFRKAVRARPDYPDALNNLGNLLRERGKHVEAIQVLRRLNRVSDSNAQFRFNLALALEQGGELDEAIEIHRALASADQDNWRSYAHIAACYRRRGELELAAQNYGEAIGRAPSELAIYNARGLIRYAQNRIPEARADFESALALDDTDARTLDNLGMSWAAEGERARARDCFERALEAQPRMGSAWRNLSELCDGREDASKLAVRAQAVFDELPDNAPMRADLAYALGNLCDRAGHYEPAFAAYAEANAARRKVSGFVADQQANYIDSLIEFFDEGWFTQAREITMPDDGRPVFIIGMPRSGTSLVEQILASHRDIRGSGELTFFPEQVANLHRRLGKKAPFPHCLSDAREALGDIARAYLAVLSGKEDDARRVTDKMPYNFLYLGLIAAILPAARVVHCRREAIATCFSIYTRDLVGNHPYAYDFDDLAAAFAGYERLMAHWRRVLPIPLYELDYEVLTSAPDAESRRLVDFLELEWDPHCLQFHTHSRAVTTASQWQVRRPIYTSARDHWRHYTQHIGPLCEALERHGVRHAGRD